MENIAHLRVHVATLGDLFDRIITPIIDMKADRLYLLKKPRETRKESKLALKKIRQMAKTANFQLLEVQCEIFNQAEVVREVKEIMNKEGKNHIFLNISSGNTVSSNAFTISGFLYKNVARSLNLYYYGYDYTNMKVNSSHLISLPAIEMRIPTEFQQKVLRYISEKGQVRKKSIMEFIHEDYPSKNKNEKSSLLMKLNRQVIDKLHYEWKMIDLSGKGKGCLISLNSKGKEFVKFL
jgi:hypothetical protein